MGRRLCFGVRRAWGFVRGGCARVEDRDTLGDWRLSTDVPLLAWELGAAVRVGSSFALVERGLADLEPVARVARALGLEAPEQGPRVVPLWHDGPVALPGAVFEGRTLPHGQLCGLWLDKAVYTPRSSVHILVACPGAKDTEVPVWIWREGQKHREMKIALGSRGLGHMELRGLPTGVWTVQLIWPQPTSSGAARFVVSDAAPPEFVARWFERRFVTNPKGNLQLAFAVGLRLHGRPVPGSVRLALRHMKSGALRWLTQTLRADPFGVVRAQIDAPGEEAWALCFVADALGSQMTQLELPPPPIGLEPVGLGPMTFGASVVVSGSTRASMGLDFLPGRALDTLPLTVAPCPKGSVLDLHVHEAIKALKVMRFEPLSCRVECIELGDVEAEQRLEVPIEDPVGLISAAGFVGMHEEPWESWGGWFAQDETPGIELSWASGVESNQGLPRVVSGAAPELSIKLHLDEPALVLLLVRRERSPLGSEVIGEILAPLGSVLWKTLGELGQTLDGKQRLESLFDAAGGRAALAQVLDRIRNPDAQSKTPALESGDSPPQRPQPWFDVDSVEGSQAEVLMLSALEVHGEGSVSLPAVSGDGVLRVEALVAHGTRWQRAGLRARLGAFAQASLRLPPFVDGTDHVQGHLLVKTWSGTSRLHLEVDGKPQAARLHPRTSDGEETLIVSGEPLPPYASLTFPVVPGRWVVRVEGSELEPPLIFHTVVSPAGRLKARRRAYKPVFEGGPVADAGVLGAESGLQVLATPERALEEMIRAVLDAPWRTCESLAAMLVAATVAHRRGWRSEAALLLTLQEVGDELAALFVPGKGFALNQKSGQISRPISDLAVRHLLRLEALAVGLNPAAKERLARVGRLARRAALASDVVIPPPPDSLRNADDADLLLRFRADRFAVAAATVRARLKRRASRRDQEASKGRSSVRGEVAFAKFPVAFFAGSFEIARRVLGGIGG